MIFRAKLGSLAGLMLLFGTMMMCSSWAQVYANREYTSGNLKYGDRIVRALSNFDVTAPENIFSVSYARFNPSKLRIGLLQPSDSTSGGTSIERFFQDNHAIAVMNGGFLDSGSNATPAGFLKIMGKIINRGGVDPFLDGFVCLNQERSRDSVLIGPFGQLGLNAGAYPDCVQAGPILAINGQEFSDLEVLDQGRRARKFSATPATRSFIGVTKGGDVILGVTSPVSLYALQAALLRNNEDAGFGVSQAINLTGRITAGLMVGEAFKRARTDTLLPNAIFVKE